MHEDRFSRWAVWEERNELANVALPGVYVVAICDAVLAKKAFSWADQIVYVGMTNAGSGLRGRLRKFDATMAGKGGHGGADRALLEHRDYAAFRLRASVSIAPFQCNPKSNKPSDLRTMGDIARFEYECLAHYVERFGRLPRFNDKAASPKFSLTIGRPE